MKYISRKIRSLLTLVVGSVFLALAGCGVSTDTGTDPGTPTLINSFSVTHGTLVAPPANPIPMNFDAANSLLFSLNWDVTSSDPFRLRLYLSDDTDIYFNTTDEQMFLDVLCGDHTDYNCSFQGSQVCGINLGLNDTLECSNDTAALDNTDITLRLDNANFPLASMIDFIVMEVCNGELDSCQTASVQVQIFDSSP